MAKRLIGLFFWERIVYLCLMGMGLGLLFAAVITSMAFSPGLPAIFTLLLGGAGFLLFSAGRILGLKEQVSRLMSDEAIGRENQE